MTEWFNAENSDCSSSPDLAVPSPMARLLRKTYAENWNTVADGGTTVYGLGNMLN